MKNKIKPEPKHRTRITRKEIAWLVELSYDTVKRNEKLWGIERFKVQVGKGSCVSFYSAETIAQLKFLGLIFSRELAVPKA